MRGDWKFHDDKLKLDKLTRSNSSVCKQFWAANKFIVWERERQQNSLCLVKSKTKPMWAKAKN